MARDDDDLAGNGGNGRKLKKSDNVNADGKLRAFIERIERLEEEKKTVADDIKDVYGEAKGQGYDTKIMKKVVTLRKKDDQERMEEDLILDTYLAALGMIEDHRSEED